MLAPTLYNYTDLYFSSAASGTWVNVTDAFSHRPDRLAASVGVPDTTGSALNNWLNCTSAVLLQSPTTHLVAFSDLISTVFGS